MTESIRSSLQLNGPAPRIGVVAIGRNEGARLVRCMASLAPLTLPVVYVDSASSDDSVATARAAGADVVELDPARPLCAARARAEGADVLLHKLPAIEFIQFVDGDCEIAPDWIAQASAFLDSEPTIAIACGRRRERHPDASVYNRLCDAEWDTPIGDAQACGGDALVRATAYSLVGGFDRAMIAGEEPELCSRLYAAGWRIRRLDAEMTIHDAAMRRFRQWWLRAVRSGFGYAQAWHATHAGPTPLYRRELVRAAGWTVLPPAAAILAAVLVGPVGLLLAPALYVAQVARLALRDGGTHLAWQHAWLLTVTKWAEAQGALRFARRVCHGCGDGDSVFHK